jgi:hypothetical protein
VTSPRVLTKRALNSALLERQLLLRRRRMPALEALERLVALQSQVPRDPHVALWSRVVPFRAETLSDALEERRAVRMTLLRGTLHLVTARDAIGLRTLVQPGIEGVIYGSSPLRTAVGSVDMAELFAALRTWLEERPRTRAELVKEIAKRWPDANADSLGYAMYALPTVQVTPRGLWRRSGGSKFTTMQAWLGASPDPAAEVETVVLRYLAAFGPATPATRSTGRESPGCARSSSGWAAGCDPFATRTAASCSTCLARRCPTRRFWLPSASSPSTTTS